MDEATHQAVLARTSVQSHRSHTDINSPNTLTNTLTLLRRRGGKPTHTPPATGLPGFGGSSIHPSPARPAARAPKTHHELAGIHLGLDISTCTVLHPLSSFCTCTPPHTHNEKQLGTHASEHPPFVVLGPHAEYLHTSGIRADPLRLIPDDGGRSHQERAGQAPPNPCEI